MELMVVKLLKLQFLHRHRGFMTTKTLIGILLIMLYMGVMIVLDIKDNKRRAGLFDDEKDFDK